MAALVAKEMELRGNLSAVDEEFPGMEDLDFGVAAEIPIRKSGVWTKVTTQLRCGSYSVFQYEDM